MASKCSMMLAAAGVCIVATAAQAQQTPLVYVVHNAPRPGCPGLVLHFRADPKTISGFASYDDMKGVSRIVGTRNGLGHFSMTLEPIDPSGPKGTIVGDASTNNADIRSILKGEGCNDGPLRIATINITNAH
jgi:hypothetical protein